MRRATLFMLLLCIRNDMRRATCYVVVLMLCTRNDMPYIRHAPRYVRQQFCQRQRQMLCRGHAWGQAVQQPLHQSIVAIRDDFAVESSAATGVRGNLALHGNR
jgi:hypothetical protein